MAKLEAIDYNAEDASEKFVASLRETGFGVLKKTILLTNSWWSLSTAIGSSFFDGDSKEDFLYNKGPQDGFFSRQRWLSLPRGSQSKISKSTSITILGGSVPMS